jgi:hypothetical protein
MPSLEQSQVAMSLRNGRDADPLAQGKVFLSMWLLYRTQRTMTSAKLARQFGFTKAYVERWLDAGCPLDGA